MKHTIIISKKDGSLQWLNPPPFKLPVTEVTRQRFSEILPTDPVRRCAFRILRKLFGEEGKVAAWTRKWRCLWTAKILLGRWRGSEFVTPFRAAAVEWEHERWEHRP